MRALGMRSATADLSGCVHRGYRARAVGVLMAAAAMTPQQGGVDNLLAAADVRQRLADGATPLRIEADFVTCSQ